MQRFLHDNYKLARICRVSDAFCYLFCEMQTGGMPGYDLCPCPTFAED